MELFAVMEREIEWSAGFLPRQGSKAQGLGWQEEKAACLRTFDTGGAIVKIVKRRKQTDDTKPVGR